MNRFTKWLAVSCMVGAAIGMMSCSNSIDIDESFEVSGVSRSVYSGANGNVSVTEMNNTNLTVSYNAGSQKNFARLFVSEGNGAGLVIANQDMHYSNGVYSYSLSHPTFTGNSKIYVGVLVNDGGVEKLVPQGNLSNTTSWTSITYGLETGSGSSAAEFSTSDTYTFIAKCSDKVLDVYDNSKTHGANIHMWEPGNNKANQQWKLESAGDGYYAIVSVSSGLSLDVDDWGTQDGANVIQWDNNKTANQLWKFEKQSNGYYKIVNKHSGKVLDVNGASKDNGANVQQWTWNGSTAQLWKVEKVGSSAAEFSSSDNYTIVAKCSGKGLDVDNWSTTHGTNIHVWELGDNQANQLWNLQSAGDGYYAIVSVHSGLSLDVDDWGTQDGANVIQWDNNKTANQLWKFEKQSNGYYKIVNKHSGKVLDVNGASKDNGANVQQWTWNGSTAQLWKVEKAGTPSVAPQPQPQPDAGLSGTLAVSEQQAVAAYSSLAAPKDSGYVSFTFENVTNGKFKNNEIFIVVLYQRNDGIYYWGRPDGTFKAVGANEYCDNYSYTIEDNNGTNGRRVFNIPKNTNGARIFYSYGSKMSIHGPENGVGVVFPSIANPGDPDYNKYYDWLEYTIRNDGVTWVNTTQVDQFGFPALITAYASNGSVRSNGDGLFTQTGVTASRDEVYKAYYNYMASKGVSRDFDCLAETYRIVCPGKSSKFNKNYLDGYINEVWDYWRTHSTTVRHAQGKFTLTSDGTNLKFYCTESYNPAMCRVGETYWVYGKPTTEQAFEGSGCLATDTKGNGMEPALQAWVCAALNRHVATRSDDPAWGFTSAPAPANYNASYYQGGAANYYSGFWHSISTNNGLAYGFCYDDVHEQSSTTVVIDCQKIWVRLGF